MIINNSRALNKANDGNQWGHNNQLVSYVFIIFIQVVNDATPWPTALGKNLYYNLDIWLRTNKSRKTALQSILNQQLFVNRF